MGTKMLKKTSFQAIRLRQILASIVSFGFIFFIFLVNDQQQYKARNVVSSIEHVSEPLQSPSKNSSDHQNLTNITHLVFALVGSTKGWKQRRPYIESWWQPNITRGYLFLESNPKKDLLPWPSTSPPYRVSENNHKSIIQYTKHNPVMVRIARTILEAFREGDTNVRWFVTGDDDSIFFLENWIETLRKYDHEKYVYIGGHSESIYSNFRHSFEMGFGGAGVAFSYPLARVLVARLDDCIRRYPQSLIDAADQMWQACLSDLGVYMHSHKGIHQIDLRGDLTGFLSAHPPWPLLSLHHPEKVNPYIPGMSRHQSVNHIMKAAAADQSRLLQQSICYQRPNNWSFSVSWGYSVQIYDKIYPRSILQKPLETFRPWLTARNLRPPLFTFNTRPLRPSDPCQTPHLFFFDSVQTVNRGDRKRILTTYTRRKPRRLPPCSLTGNHSADRISKIRVFSPTMKLTGDEIEDRRECCDITYKLNGMEIANIHYRACFKNEVIA